MYVMELTVWSVAREVALFILAGLCEIGGGWLVWQTLRESKSWLLFSLGIIGLALYGVIPTLQQVNSFGRVYAVYGGFFIVLALLWGWFVDHERPDVGDLIGACVAIVGVLIILHFPRRASEGTNSDTEEREPLILA